MGRSRATMKRREELFYEERAMLTTRAKLEEDYTTESR